MFCDCYNMFTYNILCLFRYPFYRNIFSLNFAQPTFQGAGLDLGISLTHGVAMGWIISGFQPDERRRRNFRRAMPYAIDLEGFQP